MSIRTRLSVIAITLLLAGAFVLAPAAAGAAPTVQLGAAPPDVMTKPAVDYRVSLAPSQIWDGTFEYFKARGFTTVVLIATEAIPYDKELQKIRHAGLYPILDIEHVIWSGGKNKSTPIAAYNDALSTWQKAGWNHVATEGGRYDDLDTLKDFFTGFTFFNCDQCGLWKDIYKQPDTTEMSWETYFPSEISSIQRGALISYNLGKPQGITVGVWDTNNDCLNYDTLKTLLDWSYAQDVGFTHFNVFFGLGGTLANYKRVGLDDIVSKLQKDYPPKPASAWPDIVITSVRQVPEHQDSLVWDITNLGDREAWVTPYAALYKNTPPLSGRASGEVRLNRDVRHASAASAQQGSGYGWTHLDARQKVSIVSPSTIPANTKSVEYNVYVYYNNSARGWVYDREVYTTVGCKNLETDFWQLFLNIYVQTALVILIGVLLLFTVLAPRLRQR